jgi:hypothetical protein
MKASLSLSMNSIPGPKIKHKPIKETDTITFENQLSLVFSTSASNCQEGINSLM